MIISRSVSDRGPEVERSIIDRDLARLGPHSEANGHPSWPIGHGQPDDTLLQRQSSNVRAQDMERVASEVPTNGGGASARNGVLPPSSSVPDRPVSTYSPP